MIERFGSELTRVRVGIGRPALGTDPAAHVLEPFAADEADLLRSAIDRASDAVECVIAAGVAVAMNRFNTRVEPGAEQNA
jgi:PTH1 family peptidyl-tRNA hydrolase